MTNQADMYTAKIAGHLTNIDKSLERIAGALRVLTYEKLTQLHWCMAYGKNYEESDAWFKANDVADDIISAEAEHWKSDKG